MLDESSATKLENGKESMALATKDSHKAYHFGGVYLHHRKESVVHPHVRRQRREEGRCGLDDEG